MKNIIFIILSMLFLTGCSSINTVDEETYEALKVGMEMINNDLNNYWKYDVTLSSRTKNSKKTKLEIMNNAFKKLQIKK